MGLLDFLGSDDAKLGLGLLAAGGQSATPLDTWQRVQGAMQGMEAEKANKLRLSLLASQVDENKQQALIRQQQLALAQRKFALDEQFMGGGLLGPAPSGGVGGASSGAVPAMPSGGAGPAPSGGFNAQSISQQFGIPIEAVVADYRFNEGKKIAELIAKKAEPNWVNVGGNLVNTNAQGFKGGLQDQASISSDGRATVLRANGGNPVVGAPAGGLETYGAYQGISNRSNADYTPETVIDPATGQKVVRPRSQVLQPQTRDPYLNAVIATESGGNPNAVSPKGARGLMQVMPGTNTAPGFGISPARDGSEAERTRVGQEYLGKMQERYQDPTLAAIAYNWGPGNTDMWLKGGGDYSKLPKETRDYVASVMTRTAVGSRAPAGNVVELSPAEQARNKAEEVKAVESAKADVVRDTGKQTQGKSASQALETVQRARELLQAGPTASGIGRMADTAMNFVGQNTKGAETSAALDVVAGDLLRSIPRMEGPQSDKDVENYKIQAGRVSDRDTPVPQRLAALKEVERLNLKYASLNGGASSNGGASGSFGEPAKPQEKPPTPMKGMTMDGYKFKGGNPADPNNWAKL